MIKYLVTDLSSLNRKADYHSSEKTLEFERLPPSVKSIISPKRIGLNRVTEHIRQALCHFVISQELTLRAISYCLTNQNRLCQAFFPKKVRYRLCTSQL